MRVLFIQENAISELIGLCCLSAYLKQHGHACELMLITHNRNWIEEIKNYSPDLIGFSVFTGMQQSIFRKIKQIKEQIGIPVIIGGPHPTYYPEECFEECAALDMLCRGEGEEALLSLVSALESHKTYNDIPGIWIRQCNKIINNGIAPLIKNINALPLPDRDLYFQYGFLKDFPMKRFVAGYGCPYKCSYCNQPFFREEYKKNHCARTIDFIRHKTVDRIIEEISVVKNKTNLKRIHFSDDLFCTKNKWLEEFSEKYPSIIGLPFSCSLRFDSITIERARLLKKSMCYAVQSGIESGNDYIRNSVIGKDLTLEAILNGTQILRDQNIKIYTTNIVALPGETLDNAIETIQLNQRIKSNYIRINTLGPFPKTGIANFAKAHGYLPENYSLKDIVSSDSLHIHCSTPYENEFKNIACLFYLFVKFPIFNRWIRCIVKQKNNLFFRMFGLLNLFQDVRYFQIDFISGLRFYFNTVFKSKDNVAMHWIPGMRDKGNEEQKNK